MDIISLIRQLSPNKVAGSDGISPHICRLKIIFSNILSTAIYPDTWKLVNVTHIFKKGDKQLIKNYRPISLLPVCGKILEKIIFNNLYNYFTTNNLITKNQSGFPCPDILPTDILPTGHLADGTPCRRDTLPTGHLADWTPCRLDTLPTGHLADRHLAD